MKKIKTVKSSFVSESKDGTQKPHEEDVNNLFDFFLIHLVAHFIDEIDGAEIDRKLHKLSTKARTYVSLVRKQRENAIAKKKSEGKENKIYWTMLSDGVVMYD